MTWRDLFDAGDRAGAQARVLHQRAPLFDWWSSDEACCARTSARSSGRGRTSAADARLVEAHLGLSGDEILYVGDHMFGDVHVTKERAALAHRAHPARAGGRAGGAGCVPRRRGAARDAMADKERSSTNVDAAAGSPAPQPATATARGRRRRLERGDPRAAGPAGRARPRIAPLAKRSNELLNPRWGLLMRAATTRATWPARSSATPTSTPRACRTCSLHALRLPALAAREPAARGGSR